MIQIRRNVFETNSSSTHSITMCMKSDYDLWVKNKVWFHDSYKGEFLTWEDVLKLNSIDIDDRETLEKDYKEGYIERVEDMLADYDVYSYNSWLDQKKPELERYKDEFTTPLGETIVSFGYYGEDY